MDRDDFNRKIDEWFALRSLLDVVVNIIPLALRVHRSGADPQVKLQTLSRDIDDKLVRTRLDPARVKRLLQPMAKALIAGREPTKSLESYIRRGLGTIEGELKAVPRSPDKARWFFQAAMRHQGSMEVLTYFAERGERVGYELVERFIDELARKRLPTAPLGLETVYSTTEYRFFERFGRGIAADLLSLIETELRRSFNEWIAALIDTSPDQSGIQVQPLLLDLWLCSRVPGLAGKLRSETRRLFELLVRWQHSAGYWAMWAPSKDGKSAISVPSSFSTALALVGIQRLGDVEQLASHCDRAVTWLLTAQSADGHWQRADIGEAEGSVLITVLAAEGLRRSGLPGLDGIVKKTDDWLLKQQRPLGFWWHRPWDEEFLSVVVLEYFDNATKLSSAPTGFLRIAREFLLKGADELSRATSEVDIAVAVIALYHGVEMFLYGVFTHLHIGFHRDNAQTIGLRDALTKLRTHLADAGQVPPGRTLSFENQVRTLAGDRDQVVHRGAPISRSAAGAHLSSTFQFVKKYSRDILGYELVA